MVETDFLTEESLKTDDSEFFNARFALVLCVAVLCGVFVVMKGKLFTSRVECFAFIFESVARLGDSDFGAVIVVFAVFDVFDVFHIFDALSFEIGIKSGIDIVFKFCELVFDNDAEFSALTPERFVT